jgi:hypothetical protein
MKNFRIALAFIASFGFICVSHAQVKTINGIDYEKTNNKWYQHYNGKQFEVDQSTITVKFITGVSQDVKDSIIRQNNCSFIRVNSLGYYDLGVNVSASIIEMVENFIQQPLIEVAEPNTIGEFNSIPNDISWGGQWFLQDELITGGIDAYKAWDKVNGNPSVIIGILDSGTEILHEDLKGNIWVNPGEDINNDGVVWDLSDMNGIDDDGNGYIDDLSGWDFATDNNNVNGTYFHGTVVAGIVGAETNDQQGVAGTAGGWTANDKGCSLLICQLAENNGLNSAIIDDAILYAVEMGVDVITMSLSIGYDQAVEDAINFAYLNGVFVDCSSGNNAHATINFPGYAANTFAVGGSSRRTNILDPIVKTASSNYGPGLKVVAPGESIVTTNTNNTYGPQGEGTSWAAPQVGATAGLIKSYHPDFTPADIAEAICITAYKDDFYTFTDGYPYGSWEEHVGYGKLNADRAIGIKEDIASNQTLEQGNYIRDEVHVTNNSTLTLASNSRFYLLKTGKLVVDAGATLVIKNGVKIFGDYNNNIQVDGNIQIEQNVTFANNVAALAFGGIYLNNHALQTTFNKTKFVNTSLYSYADDLTLNECIFTGCPNLYADRGNVTVSNNCNFNNSGLELSNSDNSTTNMVTVSNNVFGQTDDLHTAIEVAGYKKYILEHNQIQGYYNGIVVYNAGTSNFATSKISDNTIHNCTGEAGLLVYKSHASVENNHIYTNWKGLAIFNSSTVQLTGNLSAPSEAQTQVIRDNDSYEVQITDLGFPAVFKYNVIRDADNATVNDPLVYYDKWREIINTGNTPDSQDPNQPPFGTAHDVTYNCWGNNFNPTTDLFSLYGYYLVNPMMACPPYSGYSYSGLEEQYELALSKVNNGDYNSAKSDFLWFIHNYPNSVQAQAAMKDLFSIEPNLDSDFAGLKDYYLTNDSVVANTMLQSLGIVLANSCDVALKNWQQAIDWYETCLTNPSSLADSVFAAIDLGDIYLQMQDSGLKSTYIGQYPQYKPVTMAAHKANRNFLLSLLPDEMISDKLRTNLSKLAFGSMLQNSPNPFTSNTKIWYKIEKQADVAIYITDMTGKEIRKLVQGTKSKGTYVIDFVNTKLTPGTYFYTLILDGKKSDTKKMVLLR